MAVKQYALSHMQQRNYVIIVNLDVQGEFDSAWWPSILCNLRALNCPRNLYNLARSYFSKRVAILHTNTYKVEIKVMARCPQGTCYGPGFGTCYTTTH